MEGVYVEGAIVEVVVELHIDIELLTVGIAIGEVQVYCNINTEGGTVLAGECRSVLYISAWTGVDAGVVEQIVVVDARLAWSGVVGAGGTGGVSPWSSNWNQPQLPNWYADDPGIFLQMHSQINKNIVQFSEIVEILK